MNHTIEIEIIITDEHYNRVSIQKAQVVSSLLNIPLLPQLAADLMSNAIIEAAKKVDEEEKALEAPSPSV